MTRRILILLSLLSVAAGAQAQQITLQASTPTTTNLYAQERIDLLPGFEATTAGFEAKIQLPESTHGKWSRPLLWTPYKRTNAAVTGMIGIHTHVLPNGKVLSWEGHNDNFHMPGATTVMSHAYDWDPNPAARNGSDRYPDVYRHFDNAFSNIFCSGHTLLEDGRLLVVGGHYSDGVIDRSGAQNPVNFPGLDYIPPGSGNVNGYIGIRDGNLFHYTGNYSTSSSPWQPNVQPMSYRRWYPTATTLSNGDVLVIAGQRYGGPIGTGTTVQAEIPEVFHAAGNTWGDLPDASRPLPLYPWMFLAPDGQVFNAGPNIDTGFLNPTTAPIGTTAAGKWGSTLYPAPHGHYREYGSAVMYAPGKILILGGGLGNTITATTEHVDITTSGVATFLPATSTASMRYARKHLNATLLADGTVLVTGGMRDNSSDSDISAVLPAELWTPPTFGSPGGTWTTLAAMDVPRLYHSTAVLLPDATVLSVGGGQGGVFQDHPDYEIFTPPYLCQGLTRPQISSAPQAVAFGQSFTITVPGASDIARFGKVTLVRLSSVTHSFNMNQRFLPLTPTAATGTTLSLTAPADSRQCPPGHYMLFVLDANGTPSQASILSIRASACKSSPTITQTAGSIQNPCDRTTRFSVSGISAGTTYTWLVNGQTLAANQPSIDVATSSNGPTAQVSVELTGSPGCGVSSQLTSYFPACTQAGELPRQNTTENVRKSN
ncbi:galactose oxidase early set domain-containing protein [Hymenobacter algoricola]|uniref:DUF1929 domain-containing protein n=1 Tax=Hymenobacter algoricola TaxID=486267 RepID=A0ABP7MWU7_9BACT